MSRSYTLLGPLYCLNFTTMNAIKNGFAFDRRHIMLTNASHAAIGFGIALLLQDWLAGNAFLSVWVGWALVVFSLVVHFVALTSRK